MISSTRQGLSYIGITTLIVLLILVNIATGSSYIPLSEVWDSFFGATSNLANPKIIFQSRIPEIIMAIIVGCALSLSGLLMQTFFRNPLAGPSVLGLSSGAGLGVALAMMTGPGILPQ